jgi:hypothetical protein
VASNKRGKRGHAGPGQAPDAPDAPDVAMPVAPVPDAPVASAVSVTAALPVAPAVSTSAMQPVEPAPSTSGSIDVQLSGQALPIVDAAPAPIIPEDSRKVTALPVGEAESRGKRISHAAKDALDASVTRLGSSIETFGEGVSKLGDLSRNVPVVGASVSKIGEGISHVGESLHTLPRTARTRRGRLLIRSMIVGFFLVAAWIVVIVGLQLHGNNTPDFRPNAEQILVALSHGDVDEVYEQASPRFQEMVRKERFIDDMTDLEQTVGKFREITSISDTLVTNGPSGRVGRVSLTAAYEKGNCKVSVSLHDDEGRWRLLGVGVELPPELKISQAQREERVRACKDAMDSKRCDVHQAADAVLLQLEQGQADKVWDAATSVFQKQEQKAKFVQLQGEHQGVLGAYRRIIAVSEAKVFGGVAGGISATFDALAEFDKASGVRVVFGFYRRSKADPWKLRSFKVVLPMPRAAEVVRPGAPPVTAPARPARPPARDPAPRDPVPRDAGAK